MNPSDSPSAETSSIMIGSSVQVLVLFKLTEAENIPRWLGFVMSGLAPLFLVRRPWPAALLRSTSEGSLAAVRICWIASLDTRRSDAASVVATVLVDGVDAELLIEMAGDSPIAAVLDGSTIELLLGCVGDIGGAPCPVTLSVSHSEAAPVVDFVDFVGAPSLVAGSSVAPGLLAA